MHRQFSVLAAVVLVLTAAPTGALAAGSVAGVDLGVLPGGSSSQAVAVNDNGVVVGFSNTEPRSPKHRAVKWGADGKPVALDLLPGESQSRASQINDDEVVAGVSYDDQGYPTPVRWDRAGRVTELPLLPGHTSGVVTALTRSGTVLGRSYSDDVPHLHRAVTWSPFTELAPLPGDTETWAEAINDSGQVVGRSTGGPLGDRPVVWAADGTPRLLTSALGDRGIASGINNAGHIAATFYGADGLSHPFVLVPGGTPFSWRGTPLPEPGRGTRTYDIGEDGTVIGEFWPGSFSEGGRWAAGSHRWDSLTSRTHPLSVNRAGIVVGPTKSGPYYRARAWAPGDTAGVDLSPVWRDWAGASRINNHNLVVGHSYADEDRNTHATKWQLPLPATDRFR
ncbi:hypothetical protein [Saccharothrix obliqua]|uniref:hypothetical protein n=1 Tax=Saccharothrix obliqua TaxID=2861747 RepID=UPI001C60475B|nr:hypothetical protein [Saccharothrix obliqua]MBW4721540.1 hypothetical protein [Saccharothrix obliqua]